jgi:hypothetical protein
MTNREPIEEAGAGPPTCGKGLAARSVLPGRIADLLAAMAYNLEAHIPTLDGTDPAAQEELGAYTALARQFREVSGRTAAIAGEMAGYRDLPMARHDPGALTDPRIAHAFEAFISRERDLAALLQQQADQDRRILVQMQGQAEHAVPRASRAP